MTTCDTGDVVLLRYPFTDLSSVKQRPAVVISPTAYSQRYGDCVLMPLTSQPQPNVAWALTQWQQAGLPKATWVKPVIGTLSLSLVIRPIGKLTAADDPVIRAAIAAAIDARW